MNTISSKKMIGEEMVAFTSEIKVSDFDVSLEFYTQVLYI